MTAFTIDTINTLRVVSQASSRACVQFSPQQSLRVCSFHSTDGQPQGHDFFLHGKPRLLVDWLWIIGYYQTRVKKKYSIVSFAKPDQCVVEKVWLEKWLLKPPSLANICILEFVYVHTDTVSSEWLCFITGRPLIESRFRLHLNTKKRKLGKKPQINKMQYII